MSNKVERKTLNVAIKRHLWDSLDKEAKSSDSQLSKTQIVEKALEQYFNVVVDNSNSYSNSNSATTTTTSTTIIEPESQSNEELQQLQQQLNQLQEQLQQQEKQIEDKVNSEQLEQLQEQVEADQETLRSQLQEKVEADQLEARLEADNQALTHGLSQLQSEMVAVQDALTSERPLEQDDNAVKLVYNDYTAMAENEALTSDEKVERLSKDAFLTYACWFYKCDGLSQAQLAKQMTHAVNTSGIYSSKIRPDQIKAWDEGKTVKEDDEAFQLVKQIYDGLVETAWLLNERQPARIDPR